MKDQKFEVWFEDGTGLQTWAMSPFIAMIKMCKERHQQGKNTSVESIVNVDTGDVYEVEIKINKIKNA